MEDQNEKIFQLLTGRAFVTGLLILMQAAVLVFGILFLNSCFVYVNAACVFISLAIALYIISKPDNPAYKLAWLIPSLLFPALGGVLCCIFGKRNISSKVRRQMQEIQKKVERYLPAGEEICRRLETDNIAAYRQSAYIRHASGSPVRQNTYNCF